MSLDVYLTRPARREGGCGIFIRDADGEYELTFDEWDARFPGVDPVTSKASPVECYERNITHNLNKMAGAAGIYEHLWRPDEIGITTASQLIVPLEEGLKRLRAEPETFRVHNPSNGWGDYDGLVAFVADYLEACREYPDATVRVSR